MKITIQRGHFMRSMSYKKTCVPLLAGLILSINANAMVTKHSQTGQTAQQCAPCIVIKKPEVSPPTVSCIRTREVLTYSLKGNSTIHKQKWVTHECSMSQDWHDANCGEKCYPVEKICPGESSQKQLKQKGPICDPLVTRPLKDSFKVNYEGRKTGTVETVRFIEEELTYTAGDSCVENIPCSKITEEEFLADLTGQEGNCFTMSQAKDAVKGFLHDLKNGPITYVNGKKVTK
jgi:hypothetical protein